jgi:hypothetical protein
VPHNACYQPRKTYDPKQRQTITGPAKGHLCLVPADKNIESIEWSDHGRDPRFVAGWWIIPGLLSSMLTFLIVLSRLLR